MGHRVKKRIIFEITLFTITHLLWIFVIAAGRARKFSLYTSPHNKNVGIGNFLF
jgi:hypothetical protein